MTINSLQAFVNAVEAQSGNEVDEGQADMLVADANEIIALLSGGAAAPGRQGRLNPIGKSAIVWGRIKNGQ